ncbi:MAG TPA: hypothetical protein VHN59_19315 [Chitinophagaceae bacterium]|nr:hypothetical protein [Chitinophagaceae bacterium]
MVECKVKACRVVIRKSILIRKTALFNEFRKSIRFAGKYTAAREEFYERDYIFAFEFSAGIFSVDIRLLLWRKKGSITIADGSGEGYLYLLRTRGKYYEKLIR